MSAKIDKDGVSFPPLGKIDDVEKKEIKTESIWAIKAKERKVQEDKKKQELVQNTEQIKDEKQLSKVDESEEMEKENQDIQLLEEELKKLSLSSKPSNPQNRPEKTVLVARRMIASHLGVSLSSPEMKNKILQDKEKVKRAKERKEQEKIN